MSTNETQAGRIRVYAFSAGFVSVPREDVYIGEGGFMSGFDTDNGCYCFHSLDPVNRERVLYKGPAPKAPE